MYSPGLCPLFSFSTVFSPLFLQIESVYAGSILLHLSPNGAAVSKCNELIVDIKRCKHRFVFLYPTVKFFSVLQPHLGEMIGSLALCGNGLKSFKKDKLEDLTFC